VAVRHGQGVTDRDDDGSKTAGRRDPFQRAPFLPSCPKASRSKGGEVCTTAAQPDGHEQRPPALGLPDVDVLMGAAQRQPVGVLAEGHGAAASLLLYTVFAG
jgi:hypothetical protein